MSIHNKYYREAKRERDTTLNLIHLKRPKVVQKDLFQNIPICAADLDVHTNIETIIHTPFLTSSNVEFSDNDQNVESPDNFCLHSDELFEQKLDNNYSQVPKERNLSDLLAEWAVNFQITHSALNDLLKILKSKHSELPGDARTLLHTPRSIKVKPLNPGHYCHFGLQKCIENLIAHDNTFQNKKNEIKTVEIFINIDGLPISKSSGSQLYPILCYLPFNNTVDIVGIYHGNEKPKEANVFLKDFVDDANNLILNGVYINGQKYSLKILGFICDVPAKAYITYTKGHSGYFSCSKCTISGDYINNRVCFPSLQNFSLRQDTDFRLKLQEDHHTGISILESIPGLNMVTDFPLDPMHLLYLGVCKKLVVLLWCNGKPPGRLSFTEISRISQYLLDVKNDIPCEFNRKPRSLLESTRWKATEFRQFLLYTGPVVLRLVLNNDKYLNFVTLHVATTILSNSKFQKEYIDYAHSLFVYFVESFIVLYGKENVSHNIHNLLHICADSKKYGCLDQFSAFPAENYMQYIKHLIRKNEKPLQQIASRKAEIDNATNFPKHSYTNTLYEVFYEHIKGPLLVNMSAQFQYEKIKFKNFCLMVKEPDNCCALNDESIILIKNIVSNENEIFVIGNKFDLAEDFYVKPCKSSKFGVFVVNNLNDNLRIWNLNEISYKCVKLKYLDKFVVFPLLHSVD